MSRVGDRPGVAARIQRGARNAVRKLTGKEAVPERLKITLEAYEQRPEAKDDLLGALERTARTFRGHDATASRARAERVGPVSEVITQRPSEVPYLRPTTMWSIAEGQPLPLDEMNPQSVYLWVMDAEGDLRVAPEVQTGHGVQADRPDGRKVNHGDMNPSEDGQRRGPARAGGEINAREDGKTWVVDLASSYSFNREDGAVLKQSSLDAVFEHLEAAGSDMSRLEKGGSVYNPLLSLVGKVERTLQKLGLQR